ncbi:uncharacterized protein [Anoplolepis gracilipes]
MKAKRLHQDERKEEHKNILIELNELKEKILFFEKKVFEYKEKKCQLIKQLDDVNKIIEVEIVKKGKINYNRDILIKKNLAVENREYLADRKTTLKNKYIDDVPVLYKTIFQDPFTTIHSDKVSPATVPKRTHVDEQLVKLNYKMHLKTNLHVPKVHSSLGIVSGNSDHEIAFLPFKTFSEPVKFTSTNSKSYKTRTKMPKYPTNLLFLKQDENNFQVIDIHNTCDAEVYKKLKFRPKDIGRRSEYSNPNLSTQFPYLYPSVNANLKSPVSSIYATSHVNSNFVPALIDTKKPILPSITCIGTSHTNPFTSSSSIYTNTSHANLSYSLPPITSTSIFHKPLP